MGHGTIYFNGTILNKLRLPVKQYLAFKRIDFKPKIWQI